MNVTAQQKAQFIKTITPEANRVSAITGINPGFIASQWALETGYGTNTGYKQNNLAGVYAYPGSPYGTNGKAFSSLDEFGDTYASTLLNSKNSAGEYRYKDGVTSAKTISDFAKALMNGGYAGTSKDYAYSPIWNEAFTLFNAQPGQGEITDMLGQSAGYSDTAGKITDTVNSITDIPTMLKYGFAITIVFILVLVFLYGSLLHDTGAGDAIEGTAKLLTKL